MDLKVTNEQHLQPTQIGQNYDDAKKAKLAKAAKDFESILTQMMLKSMNQTTEGMFGGADSYGGDVYDSLFQMEIANKMSDKNGLGIAQMIFKKVTGEDMPENAKLSALASYKNSIQETSNGTSSISNLDINTDDLPNIKLSPTEDSIKRLDKYESIINDASKTYGVDADIIKSVILTESAGNPKAVSKANAKGLMQLMDSTAKDMGVKNSYDPAQNIAGGTKYLSQMIRQYNGDLKLGLAAYNAGPQNVDKHNGVPPFEETKSYIARVTGYLNYLKD